MTRFCKKGRWIAAVAAMGILSHSPAIAYFDHYMTGTVAGSLSQTEAESFTTAFREMLASVPDGEQRLWRMPARAGQAEVVATIRMTRTVTDQGQKCRQVRTSMERGSNKDQWTGWHCQQSNGEWKSRKVQASPQGRSGAGRPDA